jgi:hypothetical protein
MENLIKIFADFNNTDSKRRIRLNTIGTLNDLRNKGVILKPGLKILLDDDEGIVAPATILFSNDENIWIAEIDWNKL